MKKIQLALLIMLPVFIFSLNSYAIKTDSLLMANGDILVGEIKEMKNSVVTFKTMYSDSDFKVEWNKVKGIHSDRTFLVSLTNGQNYNGIPDSDTTAPEKVNIKTTTYSINVDISDIIHLQPVEGRLISRFKVDISFGYTYTRANNSNQYSARSNVGYIASKWGANASYNAVINSQDSIATTQRTDASIGGRILVGKGWYVLLTTNFLSNTEQKLDLRTTTEGAIGHFLINTRKMYMGASLGLAWNNETYTNDENATRNSIEGYIGLDYNIFDVKDFSLLTGVSVYPGITEKGRLRADLKFDLKYDLPYDFFVKLGVTYNYDNRPIEGASSKDYVFQTTFGWEL